MSEHKGKLLQVRVPEGLLDRIDAARGDASRSLFVRRAIEQTLMRLSVERVQTILEPPGKHGPVASPPEPRWESQGTEAGKKQDSVPTWRCTKCDWVSYGSTSQCPKHGYGPVEEVVA